jgi:hypothetical protein
MALRDSWQRRAISSTATGSVPIMTQVPPPPLDRCSLAAARMIQQLGGRHALKHRIAGQARATGEMGQVGEQSGGVENRAIGRR